MGDEEESEVSGYSLPTKTRSEVYTHFNWNPTSRRYECKYCNCHYAVPKAGGTGSLTNHIKRIHPEKQTSSSSKRCEPAKKITQAEYNNKAVKFVVMKDQAFELIEAPSFVDLVYCNADPENKLKLPKRKKVKQLIEATFASKREELKKILHGTLARTNLVIDCWTSKNGHSFQGVVATWIDDKFTLKVAMLDLTRINGAHSGQNLAFTLSKVIDEFELWPKILTVTSDNAGNMTTLYEHLDVIGAEKGTGFNSKNHRIRCMAHIINLSCKAILKTLDVPQNHLVDSGSEDDLDLSDEVPVGLIPKIRKSVKKIRNSQEKRDTLRRQCQMSGLKPNELILDNATRWNSTLMMIERLLKIKTPYILTVANHRDLEDFKLCDEEWTMLEDLVNLLRPFRDATEIFSANEPTLSSTLPVYEILFTHLESYVQNSSTETPYRHQRNTDGYPTWLKDAANSAWHKLTKYYPSADGLAYKVATILDPRLKDKWYSVVNWKNDWIQDAVGNVRSLWNEEYKSLSQELEFPEETYEPSPKRIRNSVMTKIYEQMKTIQATTVPEDEFSRYLRDPVVTEETLRNANGNDAGSILNWWKLHQDQYPNLSRMAKDYLSILGTGVPVERLFSSATDTLTHRRYALNPQSLNECLFLKSLMKVEDGENIGKEIALAIKEQILGEESEEDDI